MAAEIYRRAPIIPVEFFNMPKIDDMGPMAYFPSEGRRAADFITQKIQMIRIFNLF
jgi:hypothetical protein